MMQSSPRIADYLDAIKYRRYSLTLLQERRRLLALAIFCGDDDWIRNAPMETVLATVRTRFNVRTMRTLKRLEIVVADYRQWRREQEAGDGV
jgi:hypothetical protein